MSMGCVDIVGDEMKQRGVPHRRALENPGIEHQIGSVAGHREDREVAVPCRRNIGDAEQPGVPVPGLIDIPDRHEDRADL